MSNVDPRQEIRNAPERDPAELQSEADAARERIQRTIDNLDRRLSPGYMFDRALDAWRHRERGENAFTTNLVRTVRANPVPVVVSSVGLAWLAASDRRGPVPAQPRSSSGSSSSNIGQRASQAASRATQAASGVTSSARDAMGSARGAVGSARSRATRARGSMSGQGARAREGFSRLQDEQPFLIGAIGIALGAALGGAMPTSRTERSIASQYGGRVREAAEDTATAAREEAAAAVAPEKGRSEPEREQGPGESESGETRTSRPGAASESRSGN